MTAERCSPILKAVYGETCVDVSTVRRWSRNVKLKESDLYESSEHDQQRSER